MTITPDELMELARSIYAPELHELNELRERVDALNALFCKKDQAYDELEKVIERAEKILGVSIKDEKKLSKMCLTE